MKRMIVGLALAALALPLTVVAQETSAAQALEQAMKNCFEKHKGVMEKPAVQNPRDCWRVHGHPSRL